MTEAGLGTTTYGYRDDGLLASLTNRFAETTSFLYDAAGRHRRSVPVGLLDCRLHPERDLCRFVSMGMKAPAIMLLALAVAGPGYSQSDGFGEFDRWIVGQGFQGKTARTQMGPQILRARYHKGDIEIWIDVSRHETNQEAHQAAKDDFRRSAAVRFPVKDEALEKLGLKLYSLGFGSLVTDIVEGPLYVRLQASPRKLPRSEDLQHREDVRRFFRKVAQELQAKARTESRRTPKDDG